MTRTTTTKTTITLEIDVEVSGVLQPAEPDVGLIGDWFEDVDIKVLGQAVRKNGQWVTEPLPFEFTSEQLDALVAAHIAELHEALHTEAES